MLKRTPKKGGLRLVGTYLFKDKDPAVDYTRTSYNDSGMTNTQIAHIAGVSPNTVYQIYEGKTSNPRFSTMVRIARAIGPEAERALAKCITSGGERKLPPKEKE